MIIYMIGTREEWLEVRRVLLVCEKELTWFNDELMVQWWVLLWVLVEKEYVFDIDDGLWMFVQLFDGCL